MCLMMAPWYFVYTVFDTYLTMGRAHDHVAIDTC